MGAEFKRMIGERLAVVELDTTQEAILELGNNARSFKCGEEFQVEVTAVDPGSRSDSIQCREVDNGRTSFGHSAAAVARTSRMTSARTPTSRSPYSRAVPRSMMKYVA